MRSVEILRYAISISGRCTCEMKGLVANVTSYVRGCSNLANELVR